MPNFPFQKKTFGRFGKTCWRMASCYHSHVNERSLVKESMEAITYLRVSTKRQGQSGLGLDAQRQLIDRFLEAEGGTITQEYVETLSGAKNDRILLKQAISHAKSINGVLVIAKLDRISRSVSFIASLMEAGVNFRVAEMPNATHFQLHIYAALAQEERRLISERTKTALKAAKARGVRLGTASKQRAAANKQKADKFASVIGDRIKELQAIGQSFSQIADSFNQKGITSYRGGRWHSTTVWRTCKRFEGAT